MEIKQEYNLTLEQTMQLGVDRDYYWQAVENILLTPVADIPEITKYVKVQEALIHFIIHSAVGRGHLRDYKYNTNT